MSAQATQATHQNDPGEQAADAHAHRQVLNDLINMGTDLARLLHAQATAQAQAAQGDTAPQPAPPPTTNASVPCALATTAAAFDRISRGVRRCITLTRSLAKPIAPAQDPARHRTAARKRILRDVEDVIGRKSHNDSYADCDNAEALTAELRERLDAPDLDDDISSRPVADIIQEICRDLGLDAFPGTQPWKRRTPEDIAQLCARAAAPSAARQPGPKQGPGRDAAPQLPDPPDNRAAIPRERPGPIHTSSDPPDDPAALIATIPRHPANARWQPPPD